MPSTITDNGFHRDTLDELETEVKASFTAALSTGGNSVSLEPEDLLGALSGIVAQMRFDIDGNAESSYYSLFISTATGVQLDRAAAPITRFPSAAATSPALDFTGTNGVFIPAGTIFETEDARQYTSDNDVTIAGGVGTTPGTAVVAGTEGNAPAGAVDFIPFPISGLDTVTNSSPFLNGRGVESDADFRARAIASNSTDRTSSLPAIVSAAAAVDGVTAVSGSENDEAFFVGLLPPNSVAITVQGGADQEIGEAIYGSKSGGIETFGDIDVNVTAVDGNIFTVSFSRPTTIDVYVTVNMDINSNYIPSTSDDIVKDRIIDYIGGINTQGQTIEGTQIGEDVFAWKAEGNLFDSSDPNAIPGIEAVTVELGEGAPDTLDKIVVDTDEEGVTDLSFITLVQTPV